MKIIYFLLVTSILIAQTSGAALRSRLLPLLIKQGYALSRYNTTKPGFISELLNHKRHERITYPTRPEIEEDHVELLNESYDLKSIECLFPPQRLYKESYRPALHDAIKNKDPQAVHMIPSYQKYDLESADENGYTPLIYAVQTVQFDVIQNLLAQGVDPNQTDLYGRTPLHTLIGLAYSYHVDTIIQILFLLVQYKANPYIKDTVSGADCFEYARSKCPTLAHLLANLFPESQ